MPRLLYLQHAYRLSVEAVVARWVENPYFQHRLPIDPSLLTRWRGRINDTAFCARAARC